MIVDSCIGICILVTFNQNFIIIRDCDVKTDGSFAALVIIRIHIIVLQQPTEVWC